MTIKEFEQRAKFNGGYDREFGEWKVIDIHEIPEPFLEQHEIDFYCCNSERVYLLRLRNREVEKYTRVTDDKTLTYLIAELQISNIDNEFINKVLLKFCNDNKPIKFDPTFDYGKEDLKKEDNLVLWKFGELIKTLIVLSSSSERQKEIIGLGAVADEMAIDFDTYFTSSFRGYYKYNLLTDESLERLKRLDNFLEKRSGEKCPDFWDDSQLATSNDWIKVRSMAKDILKIMNMDNLNIEFDRQEKYEETEQGKRLVSQWTKTRLVKR